MCGIVGGVTERNVVPILVEGLKRLEYRGYDSAGIAFQEQKKIALIKSLGRVQDLENKLNKNTSSTAGIAHTRWATHGIPSEKNAHPHVSNKNIYVVHNGIIENHEDLKSELKSEGFKLYSQTDSEVIGHLIEFYKQRGMDFDSSVMKAISRLKGAYALAVMDKNEPETLIGVRQSSPLVVGEGFDENFLASDIMALSPVTNKFKFLDDGQVAFVTKNKISISSKDGRAAKVPTKEVDSTAYTNDLNGYSHFMEKEIFEQPESVQKALEGRVTKDGTREGIFGAGFEKKLKNIENIQIVACGTSYHAGRIFEYWSHKFLGINCRVDYGSEYQYQEPVKTKKTLLVTISQSGETADTLASLKFAKKTDDPLTLTICNVANSSLCRESEYTLLTNAGPEIGVASTKAFVTQLACLNLLLLTLMGVKEAKPRGRKNIAAALLELPKQLEKTLKMTDTYKEAAKLLFKRHSTLFLGRGLYFPIAREGALKLKEISYIHAEAYPAGELKHGPLALIDEEMPVIALAPESEIAEKLVSNLEEVKARGGTLYVFSDPSISMDLKSGRLINMPKCDFLLTPIIYTIPLQILSYEVALLRGTDIDQPRNLAKSVTVE